MVSVSEEKSFSPFSIRLIVGRESPVITIILAMVRPFLTLASFNFFDFAFRWVSNSVGVMENGLNECKTCFPL